MAHGDSASPISLPEPGTKSEVSVERALIQRRSVREYRDGGLSLQEASQLLWAAQGVTHSRGYRTAPSAGALFPLEVYLLAGSVSGLPAGVYRYIPEGHGIVPHVEGDLREKLCQAALEQSSIKNAPAVLVLTVVCERTTRKYGERGIRYAHMEAGHAAQNVSLQVVSLGLGSVAIGAFKDQEVKSVMNLPKGEEPLYIIPVGR